MAASYRGSAAVLLAWCLLTIGDSDHGGYYTTVALCCVVAGFLVLLTAVAWQLPLAVPNRTLLAAPVLVCIVEAIVNPTRIYLYHLSSRQIDTIRGLGVATACAVGLSLFARARWSRPAWLLVLGLAVATGIATISIITDPHIDVWALLQQSSTGLLHGDDLYRQHWSDSTGLQTVYPYLPGSTLVLAPFRWLLGDVRYGLVVASLLGAWVIRRLARPTGSHGAARTGTSTALAGLILAMPSWDYLVDRSWTEPLLVSAIALAILAVKSGRTAWAIVALGVALACKQHVILLLPLFVLWPSFGLRRTIKAGVLGAAIVAPWFIAGPHDMWHDAVDAELGLRAKPTSLNLQAALLRHGDHVGGWFLLLALLLAYGLVAWRVPRTPSGLALGCAVVMWTFDLANTQTFFNHFVLPMGLLLVALAAAVDTVAATPPPVRPAPTAAAATAHDATAPSASRR